MTTRLWAVLPAAGVGRRMGSTVPKQYLELADRTVIEHTLELFVSHDRLAGVVVALGVEDGYWDSTAYAAHPRVRRAPGGAERCHSVLNALSALDGQADADDWVLVHDAARPCLRLADLDRLIDSLLDDAVGGLLGIPVRDTMKRAGAASASTLRSIAPVSGTPTRRRCSGSVCCVARCTKRWRQTIWSPTTPRRSSVWGWPHV
jgi:2-C-methyl-D-erythritol 4-phosphate cytidylyltransferase